ncbi:MAG TPA: diacylglycerol kinase family protein [Candidatus Melainabacteria bacterium]|nr:diacylglycerol kinase family protein [Candidatus Melainabacteria bacterium]HIN65289.1 diacylglycerol kinase family protein [Candidatus Obscuribacterales bacterium]
MTAGTVSKAAESNALNSSNVSNSATIINKRETGKHFAVPASWQHKTGRTTSMIESFYHAFTGILQGLKEQRNLRIHFAISAVVICLGIFLRVDTISWLALVLSMGLVIGAELLNTAIEHVVDLTAGGEYHLAARKAKDTAAAAVLVVALAASAVGAIVFLPRLCAYFGV